MDADSEFSDCFGTRRVGLRRALVTATEAQAPYDTVIILVGARATQSAAHIPVALSVSVICDPPDTSALRVLQAGANDLGHGLEPRETAQALASLHAIAAESCASTIVLTIPETRSTLPSSVCKWQRELRDATNQALAEELQGHAVGRDPTLVDSAALLPYVDGPHWDADGLHPSAAGYETLARGLASRVRGGATGARASAPAS